MRKRQPFLNASARRLKSQRQTNHSISKIEIPDNALSSLSGKTLCQSIPLKIRITHLDSEVAARHPQE